MKNCPACKNENQDAIDNCSFCSFPFSGTEKEKSIHIGQFISKKGVVYDSDSSLERSKKILIIIALINILFGIVFFLNGKLFLIDLLFNLAVAGVFLWCAITIKTNPSVKIIISLSVYLGVQAINYIIDSNSLIQGMLIKAAVIGSLIYSLYLINSSNKFKKKYRS